MDLVAAALPRLIEALANPVIWVVAFGIAAVLGRWWGVVAGALLAFGAVAALGLPARPAKLDAITQAEVTREARLMLEPDMQTPLPPPVVAMEVPGGGRWVKPADPVAHAASAALHERLVAFEAGGADYRAARGLAALLAALLCAAAGLGARRVVDRLRAHHRAPAV